MAHKSLVNRLIATLLLLFRMKNSKNIAIIDIGSNSVRERISFNDKVFLRRTITTQLARDMKNGVLNPSSVERTFLALNELINLANQNNAQIYAFATAAVRNAVNGNYFAEQFFARYGVQLEILSGKQEAQMGILGALNGKDGCVIDVGGASSEIVIAKNKKIIYSHSMQIGAVSLTDACKRNYKLATKTLAVINEEFKDLPPYSGEINAIGGTANNIGFIQSGLKSYNRDMLDGQIISQKALLGLVKRTFSLTPEQIESEYNISSSRAQIIHNGALILYTLVKKLNANQITLTENDNLEGFYLHKIYKAKYEE